MGLKFNPLTGQFDLVGSGGTSSSADNFSYEKIPTGSTVEIPINQQMITHQNLLIDGTLISTGTLVII